MRQSPTHFAVLMLKALSGYFEMPRKCIAVPFRDLCYEIERFFNSFVSNISADFQLRVVCVPVKPKHIERVVRHDGDQRVSTGPYHLKYKLCDSVFVN